MKVLFFDADQECQDFFTPALSGDEVIYIAEPLSKEELLKHQDADIVSVFVSSGLRQEHIDLLPKLRLIAARSTGTDNIDVDYAKSKGIVVSNVPKYGAHTVAEFTFALILAVSRKIFEAVHQVKEDVDFRIKDLEGFSLFGKTLGVIGTGSIGRSVVGIAKGFGMKVLMFDAFPNKDYESENSVYAPLGNLLSESDIITLHLPYSQETHYFLGKNELSKMKRGAVLINTARGELVDTSALLEALKDGTVGGAGLDVLEGERMLKDEMALVRGDESIQDLKSVIRDHILIDMPNVVVTPHIAFFSKEAYGEILSTTAKNILDFRKGNPANTV